MTEDHIEISVLAMLTTKVCASCHSIMKTNLTQSKLV